MYIFILSILVVSFIALCFFKKRFWENRYLVLLISGCVALVATLTTNYVTRDKLGTKIETLWEKKIQSVAFNVALVDSSFFTKDSELSMTDHIKISDSTKTALYSHHLFYYKGANILKIGYVINDGVKYKYLKNVYVAPSQSDTVAYFAKLRQYYNKRSNKWVANMSLPYIKTSYCFYFPPAEYATIPDSLIRKLPF